MDVWRKKLWYSYTMDHYTAVKKRRDSYFSTAWTDMDKIMLSELSQSVKEKISHYLIHMYIFFLTFLKRYVWTFINSMCSSQCPDLSETIEYCLWTNTNSCGSRIILRNIDLNGGCGVIWWIKFCAEIIL